MAEIVLRWPADSRVPTIHGKWVRLITGEIQAAYTLEELAWAVQFAKEVIECQKNNKPQAQCIAETQQLTMQLSVPGVKRSGRAKRSSR